MRGGIRGVVRRCAVWLTLIREMKMTGKEEVETVLDEHPETRGDNRFLLFRVWERQGLQLTPEQWEMVSRLRQPETIRRTRAKLQNEDGRFLP
jgi:hypothetical protein